MKALFLAAGFSTRLRPLTTNFPKGLLKVGDKPIISHLLDQVIELNQIDEIALVTNDICFPHYQHYIATKNLSQSIKLLNNGIQKNENRVGAIGDLNFALEKLQWKDDLLVLPSDTLVSIVLHDLIVYFNQHHQFINVVIDLKDTKKIKQKLGCVIVNNQKIIGFEEKPTQPKSTMASVPIYIYPKEILQLIKVYINEGNNVESPGSIMPWIIKKTPALAYVVENGYYHDVGTLEAYSQLNKRN